MNYATFLSLAESQKSESSTLVYDVALRSKFHGFTPLQLLAYILGSQPWAVSTSREVSDDLAVGYVDTEWIRDSHAVLVKQKNILTKKQSKQVIQILVDHLTNEQIEIILQRMVKRTATMEEKEDKEKNKVIKKIILMETENLDGTFTKERKQEILEVWFGNVVIGPLMITRSLSLHNVEDYDFIEGPIIKIIRNNMDIDLYSGDLDHITLLDDRYFLISGEDATAMNWPHDIMYDFIGIAEDKQKYEEKQVKRLKKYKRHLVKGMNDSDDSKYYSVLEENEHGVYLRLHYGKNVFKEVNHNLNQIFNSEDFHVWLKSRDVNLDLWYGRDEKNKMEDHRKLQHMYQQLALQNDELQKELVRLKN